MATSKRVMRNKMKYMVSRPQPDDEWEEEEQFVLVELSGVIDPDFLTRSDNKCKILGIDTDQPVIQVDRHVFAGQYEDALGTCVIFEEQFNQDSEAEEKIQLKYKCHTAKKLKMTRTFLSEKKEGEEPSTGVEMMQMRETVAFRRPNQICSYSLPIENAEQDTGQEIQEGAPIDIPSHSSDSEVEDSEDDYDEDNEAADVNHEVEKSTLELQESDPENPDEISEFETSANAGADKSRDPD
ncbi:general transcription factor 3C polypeptide 6 [Protopterus annectens]|uniref:general transcription factor 3C polypeptide 6 n=1 Tax=Protopterus annectens TaxID=7888 RepID=UPI001CFB8233|nr:general transcription factor 3C polypeptide 6 [Protopterus annectens]